MQRIPHPWLRLTTLVALAALLACGSLTACSTSLAGANTLPTATSGDVTIAVSQSRFTVNDPVGVTVTNSSQNTYYALSGRSACTFLQMQQWDAARNTWVNVFGCPTPNPTALAIIPSISEPFTLAPNSPDNENTWDPGTYRVALPYSASSTANPPFIVAFSAGFTIVSS